MRSIHLMYCLIAIFIITTFDCLAQDNSTPLTKYYEKNAAEKQNSINGIRVEKAITAALNNSYDLKENLSEITISQKLIDSESLWPNPELSFELENILGSETFTGLSSSEITASISQEFLTSGKLHKRGKIAQLNKQNLFYVHESKKLELISSIRKIYNSISSHQEKILLFSRLIELSNNFQISLRQRVQIGLVSRIELAKAKLDAINLSIKQKSTRSDLFILITQLESMTGINYSAQEEFSIDEFEEVSIMNIDNLVESLNYNPALSIFNNLEKLNDAEIDYQEALTIPDLKIAAGIRRLNEFKANTFLIGVSVPLPLFNTNTLEIEIAEVNKNKSYLSQQSIKREFEKRLRSVFEKASNDQQLLKIYEDELLPEAEQSIEELKRGHNSGRYSTLDVLDSHRAIAEIEMQYIETKERYRNSIIELEKLIAQKLDSIKLEKS